MVSKDNDNDDEWEVWLYRVMENKPIIPKGWEPFGVCDGGEVITIALRRFKW